MKRIELQLYDARKDVGDPRLACLSLRIPAEGKEIWLYRNPNAQLT